MYRKAPCTTISTYRYGNSECYAEQVETEAYSEDENIFEERQEAKEHAHVISGMRRIRDRLLLPELPPRASHTGQKNTCDSSHTHINCESSSAQAQ